MTSYHLQSVPEGWAVFDANGKRYGAQPNRKDALQLLRIRRHMALAGCAAVHSAD